MPSAHVARSDARVTQVWSGEDLDQYFICDFPSNADPTQARPSLERGPRRVRDDVEPRHAALARRGGESNRSHGPGSVVDPRSRRLHGDPSRRSRNPLRGTRTWNARRRARGSSTCSSRRDAARSTRQDQAGRRPIDAETTGRVETNAPRADTRGVPYRAISHLTPVRLMLLPLVFALLPTLVAAQDSKPTPATKPPSTDEEPAPEKRGLGCRPTPRTGSRLERAAGACRVRAARLERASGPARARSALRREPDPRDKPTSSR